MSKTQKLEYKKFLFKRANCLFYCIHLLLDLVALNLQKPIPISSAFLLKFNTYVKKVQNTNFIFKCKQQPNYIYVNLKTCFGCNKVLAQLSNMSLYSCGVGSNCIHFPYSAWTKIHFGKAFLSG